MRKLRDFESSQTVVKIVFSKFSSAVSVDLRVNTVVQQFPQFNETYGIKEGDGKWIKPEDRVPVW
jgi:predicted metalloendopeptidase